MSSKAIEVAKAEVTISYPDGRKLSLDLTSVRFEESLPADRSYPAFFLEGKVNGRSLSFSCPKGKVPDVTDPEILGFRATTVGGLDRYWAYTVAKRKATPAEEAQRTRDEERKSIPPWTILGPSYPTFPLKPEHRVSYPTPHKTCVCDIKDLMSTGHRSGCPEKKR